MTSNINTIVDLVHPTQSGVGVITTDQIWVLFDREIDETTVEGGNLFITGPDFDTWSGPDLQLFLDRESLGDEEEILQSPGFHGILQGATTFQRISPTSLVTVSGTDHAGSGLLYRTKAIFTPTNRLQANTTYNVYLSGDEDDSDSLQTGISSRTVFDTLASGTNVGSGIATFTGGYIGLAEEDAYRVRITTAGDVDTARFTFVRDSDPSSVYGPFRTKRSGTLLSDGVTVSFNEASYYIGDQWSVVVKERQIFSGNLYWPFTTGSGSIESIPTTTATSIIGDPAPVSSSSSSSSTFSVSSTSPANYASDVTIPTGDFTITATFNNSIDATSVTADRVSIYAEASTGEEDVLASGFLSYTSTVSGQVLTMTVPTGWVKQNNYITVTLDSDIQSTGAVTLGSDYSFSFSTDYYPMYCTLRRMRLMVGAFIDDIADDTVNLAIHLASKEADALTWNDDNPTDEYFLFTRSQWTCCRAAQILLINTTGGVGALKSKRLGDLQVDYDTTTDVSKPLQNAELCMAKWEGAVMAGGRQVQSPTMVVKGDLDIDRPPVGRGWLHTRDLNNSSVPVTNRQVRLPISRRYRGVYTRQTYPKGWWNR